MKITDIQALFFKNVGIRQTIFKNTFWLIFAEMISRVLSLALIVYVTRMLGAIEYGKFAFAFSFVSVIVIFSDLGVIDTVTRDFSRNKEKEKEFSSVFTLDIILSTGALILMLLGSFLITSNPAIQKIIWVLSFFILITSFFNIFFTLLRSRQKMEYEAIIKVVQTIIIVTVSFFAVSYFRSAIGLSYGYLLSNLIALTFFLLLFHFYFQSLKLKWDKDVFNILKTSWPLSLGFVNSWICISVNSIVLGYFNLLAENGWYSAASKIALVVAIPAELIVRSFYPALSNFFITSKEKLQRSWDYLMDWMIFLTIPIVIGGIVLAPKIVSLFYGSKFMPSIFAFQLLMVVIGISLVSYPFGTILVVFDQQKKNFILMLIGVLINIILDFIFVPIYGFYSIVVATIISSAVVLLLIALVSKYFTSLSFFGIRFFKNVVIAGVSGIIMFSVINLPAIYNLNIFLSATIGGLVYSFVAYLLYKIFQKK